MELHIQCHQRRRAVRRGHGDTILLDAQSDFNVHSHRSDVVMRWEWRRGSMFWDAYLNRPLIVPHDVGSVDVVQPESTISQ
jgi:hypothetical protein